MKIREAVNFIDAAIKASLTDPRWKIKQHGLAKVVLRDDRDGKRYPVVVDGIHKEDTIIDDKFTLVTYHVSNGTTYQEFEGFGNDEDDLRRVDSLMMIVYSDAKRTRTSQEAMIDIITNLMPTHITLGIDGLYSQVAELRSVNDNSLALFNSQYSGAENSLTPDSSFFGVSYTITSDYSASCLEVCSTC
jgi:hypothetical protein